jgi:uncharacterized membrane protein HdeD (DUF308 family)
VNVAALVRNWWMMAVRGGLAIVFGLLIVLWPNVTLSVVVGLFAAYAILDGAWSIAAGVRASEHLFDAWPVVLEGFVSIALGALALVWPLVPRQFLYLLAAWGVGTGLFELLAALSLPHRSAGFWLLVTGGVSSVFLATVILLLPHADTDLVARVIATYAQLFGIVMLVAAIRFPRDRARHRCAGSRG